jgi:protein-tyrosine phosphatase
MKRVLFLCSSNRYRSRFAEHLFNWLAARRGLQHRAASRGLLVDRQWFDGPMSKRAVAGLQQRGIPINARRPRQVSESDLAHADVIVAVKEDEHRHTIASMFPRWVDRVEYWHVDDSNGAGPEEALHRLENEVRMLLARLNAGR